MPYIKHIYKFSKHRFPKLVGRILLIHFAVIAFIFGIYADTLSSYDKFNSNRRNAYNWLNPMDILKFPIDQYLINTDIKNQVPVKCKKIDLSEIKTLNKLPQIKYTFIIDKTPSTKKKNTSELDHTSDDLIGELKNSIGNNEINLTGMELEDLILLCGLKQLKNINKSECEFEVRYYYGDSNFNSPFEDDILITDLAIRKLAKYIQDTVAFKVKLNKNVLTNISELVDQLCKANCIGSSDTLFNNLFIISDFEHEEESGSSFNSLNQKLQQLSQLRVRQVNLIKIKGRNNKRDNVSTTINLFRENFNDLFYYEFEENFKNSNLQGLNKTNSEITNIFSSAIDDSMQQPICLYNSWGNISYKYDYIGSVQFNCRKLFLGLGNSDERFNFGEKSAYLTMGNPKKKVYSGDLTEFDLDKDSPEIIRFSTYKTDSKNYYLEIREPNSSIKIREPIILRQVLPRTSCVYLMWLYLSFLLGVLSLAVYYIIYFWGLSEENLSTVIVNKPIKLHHYHKFILSVIFLAISLFFIITLFSFFIELDIQLSAYFGVAGVFLFYLLLFWHSVNHYRKRKNKKGEVSLKKKKEQDESDFKIRGILDAIEELKKVVVLKLNSPKKSSKIKQVEEGKAIIEDQSNTENINKDSDKDLPF